MRSPASLPVEIHRSASQGELQKVVKWLRKGGAVDAFGSGLTHDGRATAETLLHAATAYDHLAMVRELLKRGASVNLPTSFGLTALMNAAVHGHPSILLVLLQHSASLDLQASDGLTALMMAADQGHEACVQALLRAKANTELVDQEGRTALEWAENQGHTAITDLIRHHAALLQPATTSSTAPPDAGEPAESSPTPLPLEIYESAGRGELRKVAKWLRKGGLVDALCPAPTIDGQTATFGLLHAAARNDQLEMARELLKRGASVDLQGSLGSTALMIAAGRGHHQGGAAVVGLQVRVGRVLQEEEHDGEVAAVRSKHERGGTEGGLQVDARASLQELPHDRQVAVGCGGVP